MLSLEVHARSKIVWATVLFVTLVAFAVRLRWLYLAVGISLPLDADAVGYMQAAVGLIRHLGYSAAREPLFPVVAALFMSFFGTSVFAYRVTSVILGTLMAPLTYLVARKTSNPTTGLIGSLLVATDYLLVWNSIRGLREELFSCILLILVFLILWKDGELGFTHSMVIGVISGLLVLTKIEGFVVIVLLGLYSIWYSKVSRNKINWKLPATLFLSAVISVLVWLAYLALEFGNSFVQFNGWASDWAGQEVGGQSIPVSFSDYILRYHNISTFLGFLGRGLDRALLASVQWGYLTPIGFGLCCFGFLLLLKSDKATALPVVLLASLMYVPHFGMPLDQFEPRLFWPFLPIDYIMIAMASTSLYRALTQHRKILTKIGLVLNLKLSRSAKIRLLEPRFLAIIAFLLPFVIMAVHFAIYLLYFPPSNPNLPYQF